jgi:hypothetical protein
MKMFTDAELEVAIDILKDDLRENNYNTEKALAEAFMCCLTVAIESNRAVLH